MTDPKPKLPRDPNQLQKSIVVLATGEAQDDKKVGSAPSELRRPGGLNGGRARASKLIKEQRTEIAKKAASARWQDEKA